MVQRINSLIARNQVCNFLQIPLKNLERSDYSFWLPTSSDKFYPDFVALLKDGRVFVIEYKGAHLADSPDAQEKNVIGEVWAARSNGRCLFKMVGKNNYRTEIQDAIAEHGR
ncbi:hypothetical protein ACFL3Q_13835, partial [Planctomycetota bacterium]